MPGPAPRRRPALVLGAAAAACLLAGWALAGCTGGGAGAARTSTSTSTSATGTPSTGASSSVPASSGSGAATSTTSATGVRNLVVTAAVRAQLVAAGAAMNQLPAADYTGLVPGTTYYAYDPATATYWAGAGLVPSPSSMPAQVSVQDDGAYVLFDMPAGGTWRARPVGLGATPGQHACPADLPPAVVAAWRWAPGTCRPPG